MRELEVSVTDGIAAADLQEWLSNQGFPARLSHTSGTMSVGDVVILALSGATTLRAATPAIVEWIRSRRTTAEVRLGKGKAIRVDARSNSPELIAALVKAISEASQK